MEVTLWENANGKCPAGEFIEELDDKTRKKALAAMDFVEKHGFLSLRSKHLKKLVGYDLYETLFHGNKKTYRLFGVIRQGKYIIVHGFLKKSPKAKETPKKEIKTALERVKIIDQKK